MKKTILLLTLFLIYNASWGQGISILYQSPIQGHDNIIKFDYASTFHISCTQRSLFDVHFIFTDLNQIIDILVAKNIRVKDFEIIDRYVFFCGDNYGGSGILGWFDIDSLLYFGGSAHIDNTLSALGLESLDNIELYHGQGNSIHIAGYGSAPIPSSYPPSYCTCKNIAFEAVGHPTTGMQYRTLDLAKDGCVNNIVDMTVTDNFVVYLEWFRSTECCENFGIGVCLQPFLKNNMFASSPFPYYYYETTSHQTAYALDGSPYVIPENDDPCTTPPQITTTFEDEVAVISYRRDFDIITWPRDPNLDCGGCSNRSNTYLAFRTYDLSPMLYNNPVPMTAASSAQLSYPGEVSSIDGFEFDATTEHFVVLHRHETSFGIMEHAITTIDYSTHTPPPLISSYYQTAVDTRTQWKPNSLCLTFANEYTVGGEYLVTNHEYMFWHDAIVAPNVGICDMQINHMMKPIPTMVAKPEYNTNLPTSWTLLLFVCEPQADPIFEQCVSFCE